MKAHAVAATLLALSLVKEIGYAAASPTLSGKPNSQAVTQLIQANDMRATSQRLPRLYLQHQLGIRAGATRSQIDREIETMETLLAAFGKPGADLGKPYDKVANSWAETKSALDLSGKHPRHPTLVAAFSNNVFLATGKLSFVLEGKVNSEQGRVADVLSRLMALTERTAAAVYMGQIQGSSASAAVDLLQAKKEFVDGLDTVATSPAANSAIQNDVVIIKSMWVFFDQTMTLRGRMTSADLERVAKSADGMWELLTAVRRRMFEQTAMLAAAKQAGSRT